MSDRPNDLPDGTSAAPASGLSRRAFTRRAAGAAVLPALAGGLPWLGASTYARAAGANARLQIGVVGTGGMGTGHVRSLVERADRDNVACVRVCDVYRRRLDHAASIIGGSADAGTMEYREVLDAKDVDAVLIATPDHWHVKIAIEAMEAGKDVFCEKPLSHTIPQALACRDAVHRTGRVLQVGPQRTSDPRFWAARDAIADGRIGKVTWSQGSYCRNSREGQFNWRIDPDAGPKQAKDAAGYVWWDRWLGHEWGLAEEIPWNADHFFRFRKYFAYNGGVATDLLYHYLAPLLLSISGPQGEYPLRVTAAGGIYVEKDERDIPDTFMMTVDYPSEHTVLLVSVMTNDTGLPTMIRGQWGTLDFSDGLVAREQGAWSKEFRARNASLDASMSKLADDGSALRVEAPGRRDQVGNWLDAIRDGAELACDVDLGCSTMVAIKMGVEAYRQRKTMHWDAEAEEVRAS